MYDTHNYSGLTPNITIMLFSPHKDSNGPFGEYFQELNLLGRGGAVIILIMMCLPLLMATTTALNNSEQVTGLQWLFKLRGAQPVSEQVVVVTIDRGSSRNLGNPEQLIRWSRESYAKLLNRLAQLGAKTVVFDISFLEPRPQQDSMLAKAIENHGEVILFKYLKRSRVKGEHSALDIEQEIQAPEPLLKAAVGDASFTLPKFPAQVVKTELIREASNGAELTQPLLSLWVYHYHLLNELAGKVKSAGGSHTLSHAPQKDNINDYVRLLRWELEANQTFRKQLLEQLAKPKSSAELRALVHQTTQNRAHYINYYGPPNSLQIIPIDTLLNNQAHPLQEKIRNAVVYIGFAESGQTEQYDSYRTVFTSADGLEISGVEISATVFANLLHNSGIQPLHPAVQLLVLWLFTLLPLITLWKLSLRYTVLANFSAYALYLCLAVALFKHNLWLPLLAPLLLTAMSFGAGLYLKLNIQRVREKNVELALANYLPKEIAEALSYNVSSLESRHQLVQGVCLMTDIHGYTSLSEQFSPTELHQQLNTYYGNIIDIVNKHGGAISNIVGDSLLAVWTSDTLSAKICQTALKTAQEIIQELQSATNNDPDDKSTISFPTSIALHCGEFSIGHLGGRNHFEYSPVGDIVNTTSRIEQLNRKLNSQILCSDAFATLLDKDKMRYHGLFELRNKQQPVGIYEIP
ncbi:adenylate/guanylate cyclase domain-containing protein [Teredinibacter franksiae]|uniref:adenylate/guanylate cyclase domain-containing protein n=1 Tax=Teredinibacter franksiae TaxID=2761453 RepID=UPI001624538B|nr:adenylate/guanylate cyclase domain-containing protein [Teredinibacter franksiae]